jgi:ABC-2 type transport system ATP-binding protein
MDSVSSEKTTNRLFPGGGCRSYQRDIIRIIRQSWSFMTGKPEYAIEVEQLTKRYGEVLAVNEISFTVNYGEVFALLGPNGAGKTTTVEIIDTIRTPSSGKVSLLGMDVTRKKLDIVRRIGVLPQAFSSFDRLTVKETLQYYSRLFGAGRTDIDLLMELVNLTDRSKEQYRNLSGGLKQRLGIALALVNDPEVVFLDEPTTGLDPRARHEVWQVLQGLKSQGKTVFLTTHYMEEAELLADTVAIISRGGIIAMGAPGQLIRNNANYEILSLQSADGNVAEIVRGLGFEPVPDQHHTIVVRVEHAPDVLLILSALKDAGARYLGLDVRKPNLEEVFLKLTGEALHDGPAVQKRAQ